MKNFIFGSVIFVLFAFSHPVLIIPAHADEAKLPVLADVTKKSGISFVHSFGDTDLSNIVESAGVGVALFDYDGDNDLDIYFVNGCYHPVINHPEGRRLAGKMKNALYRNDGNGTFTDVTNKAGVGDTGYGMACLSSDYDNDGDADLFVTNYGPNVFYRNNGNGTFTDITSPAGLGGDEWSIGCTFLDFDRDGFLDLFVGGYLAYDPDYSNYYAGDGFPGPLSYKGVPDRLYRNRGNGTFADVSQTSGISVRRGRAMGVSSCDINNDLYPDIFVANDAMENYFYKNNGDGTFTDIALISGTGFSQNGEATSAMCPEFGDFNGDGLMDILVPDMNYSCLYINAGSEFFNEVSSRSGLAAACGQYTSWSGKFIDINNNGSLDIMLTNGDTHFYEPEEDLFLMNTDTGKLENISDRLGHDFQKKTMGRGSAVGDLDNDGDLDIVVANLNSGPTLFENNGGNRNHWLMVKLTGTKSNRDAVGACAELVTKEKKLVRQVISSSGYLSQSDLRLHFGLGKTDRVEKIEILWPGGRKTALDHPAVNQILYINEPE